MRARALLSVGPGNSCGNFTLQLPSPPTIRKSIVLFDSQLPLPMAKQSVSTTSNTVILSSVPGHCPLTTRAAIDRVPAHFEFKLWEGNGQINLYRQSLVVVTM